MATVAKIETEARLVITAITDKFLEKRDRALILLKTEEFINSLPPIVTDSGTVGVRLHIKGE